MLNYKKILLSTLVAGVLATSSYAKEDKVYATVNGDSIKASDIAVVLKDPRINFDSLPKENQKQVIDQLIDRKLLANNALKTDIVKSADYKTTLENTIQTLKEDLALQMWVANMSKNVKVTDDDAKKFYEENKANFKKPEQYRARHILLKTEQEAKDIISELQKAKNLKDTFIILAKEKSTGPSGKNGGDLDWFFAKQMVPEFSLATSFLKVGTITKNPVKTQFGYHVIYLEDKKPASESTYEEVKDNLKQMLGQEQFKKMLEDIVSKEKKSAKIIYK